MEKSVSASLSNVGKVNQNFLAKKENKNSGAAADFRDVLYVTETLFK